MKFESQKGGIGVKRYGIQIEIISIKRKAAKR